MLVDDLGIDWQVALALILLSMKLQNNIEANIQIYTVHMIKGMESLKIEFRKIVLLILRNYIFNDTTSRYIDSMVDEFVSWMWLV